MNFKNEIKAVFFDLDGTLLPMEQDYFVKQYFKGIAAHAAPHGIDPKTLIDATVAGTRDMIKNNGERTNMEVFWDRFFAFIGEERKDLIGILDEYYLDGFKRLSEFTGENKLARNMIEAARGNGRKVVLATNPVFPMQAQRERISWIGLNEGDFDHITSYENSSFCKPNPKYYLDICEKMGVAPENCLMIGNDESDDMKGASAAGIECFLVTDCRIVSDNFVWTGERGSFEQALRMVERI